MVIRVSSRLITSILNLSIEPVICPETYRANNPSTKVIAATTAAIIVPTDSQLIPEVRTVASASHAISPTKYGQ
jgi:hypothetical protein